MLMLCMNCRKIKHTWKQIKINNVFYLRFSRFSRKRVIIRSVRSICQMTLQFLGGIFPPVSANLFPFIHWKPRLNNGILSSSCVIWWPKILFLIDSEDSTVIYPDLGCDKKIILSENAVAQRKIKHFEFYFGTRQRTHEKVKATMQARLHSASNSAAERKPHRILFHLFCQYWH